MTYTDSHSSYLNSPQLVHSWYHIYFCTDVYEDVVRDNKVQDEGDATDVEILNSSSSSSSSRSDESYITEEECLEDEEEKRVGYHTGFCYSMPRVHTKNKSPVNTSNIHTKHHRHKLSLEKVRFRSRRTSGGRSKFRGIILWQNSSSDESQNDDLCRRKTSHRKSRTSSVDTAHCSRDKSTKVFNDYRSVPASSMNTYELEERLDSDEDQTNDDRSMTLMSTSMESESVSYNSMDVYDFPKPTSSNLLHLAKFFDDLSPRSSQKDALQTAMSCNRDILNQNETFVISGQESERDKKANGRSPIRSQIRPAIPTHHTQLEDLRYKKGNSYKTPKDKTKDCQYTDVSTNVNQKILDIEMRCPCNNASPAKKTQSLVFKPRIPPNVRRQLQSPTNIRKMSTERITELLLSPRPLELELGDHVSYQHKTTSRSAPNTYSQLPAEKVSYVANVNSSKESFQVSGISPLNSLSPKKLFSSAQNVSRFRRVEENVASKMCQQKMQKSPANNYKVMNNHNLIRQQFERVQQKSALRIANQEKTVCGTTSNEADHDVMKSSILNDKNMHATRNSESLGKIGTYSPKSVPSSARSIRMQFESLRRKACSESLLQKVNHDNGDERKTNSARSEIVDNKTKRAVLVEQKQLSRTESRFNSGLKPVMYDGALSKHAEVRSLKAVNDGEATPRKNQGYERFIPNQSSQSPSSLMRSLMLTTPPSSNKKHFQKDKMVNRQSYNQREHSPRVRNQGSGEKEPSTPQRNIHNDSNRLLFEHRLRSTPVKSDVSSLNISSISSISVCSSLEFSDKDADPADTSDRMSGVIEETLHAESSDSSGVDTTVIEESKEYTLMANRDSCPRIKTCRPTDIQNRSHEIRYGPRPSRFVFHNDSTVDMCLRQDEDLQNEKVHSNRITSQSERCSIRTASRTTNSLKAQKSIDGNRYSPYKAVKSNNCRGSRILEQERSQSEYNWSPRNSRPASPITQRHFSNHVMISPQKKFKRASHNESSFCMGPGNCTKTFCFACCNE